MPGFSLVHKFVRFDTLSTRISRIFEDSAPHWAQFPSVSVNLPISINRKSMRVTLMAGMHLIAG